MGADAPQDLLAVDLPHDDLRNAHAVTAYGIPPPLQWNIGRVRRKTSRSVSAGCQPRMAALSQQLRCVSWTPLGRAVAPLV